MFSTSQRVRPYAFAVLSGIGLVLFIAGCGSSSTPPGTTAGLASATAPSSGGTGSANGGGTASGGTTGGSSGTGTTSGGSGSGSGGGSGSTTANGGSSGSGTTTGGSTSGGGTAQNPPTCDGLPPGVVASGPVDDHPLDSTFLYVAGGCKVAGFSVADDGALKPTPDSPYAAPGEILATHPTLSILYGSDTNELASYSIGTDGGLRKLANYTKRTDGNDFFAGRLAIDPLGKALYAVEGHSALNQTIEVFTANLDGTLTHLQNFETGPAIRSLSFSADATLIYRTFCSHLGEALELFKRNPDGTLSFQTDGYTKSCPIAASMSRDGNYFAMAGIVSQNYTSIDNVLEILSSDAVPGNGGFITELKGSPYSIGLINISDVTWHPSGEFLAVGAQNGISVYRFEAGSAPVSVDGSPFANDSIDHLKFNKAGTLLFGTSSNSQRLYVFKFREGKLIPAPGSPYALSIAPYNLAIVN